MTASIRRVMFPLDLPLPELCAARLDGELFGLDEGFCPTDLPVGSSQRALALAQLVPERVIAEQHSAAWVLGVSPHPPKRHQLCVTDTARARPANPRGFSIREVVISAEELLDVEGFRVTTPLRTAIDILRWSERLSAEGQDTVLALLKAAEASVLECRRHLETRRNLPGKQRTLARLRQLELHQWRTAAA